jgi:hypothetical protein
VLGIAVLVGLIIMNEVRFAITLTVGFGLVALAAINIRLSILATVVYLIFLGDLRRMLIPLVGWSGQDPLLLIGPAFAIVLFGYAWASRSVTLDTPLTKWVLLLMGIMALQIFNPKQGRLIVGVAGIMFLMIPLVWFWIGRTFATPRFMKTLLYKVVVPLAFLAMLMGLYQSFYGYLPYQLEWYHIAGYIALGTPGSSLAPISFFSSGTEHNLFLNIALILLWAAGLKKNRTAFLLVPLFFIAILLSGSRGPIAKGLFMLTGLWAIMGRSTITWITRGAMAILIAGFGLFWSLSQVTQMNINDSIEGRINRQAQEFAHAPRGSEDNSSAANHLGMLFWGYASALQHPLGLGLGATTKAAMKFGGTAHSSETDLGNSFRSLGIPGGITYHIIVLLIIITGFRYWVQTRSLLALALLGVIGVTFLMWLGGGNYAVNPIIWLCIGALDRFHHSKNEESVTE